MKLVNQFLFFSLTSFLLIFFTAPCISQVLERPELQQKIQPVVDNIYNLEHVTADRQLTDLYRLYPADPAIPLLRALNRFWQAELSRKHGYYNAYIYAQLEEAHDKNKAFENSPAAAKSYHFVEFMGYALEARLNYFEESDWGAVNAARKILSHLDEAIELAPGSPEFSLIAGLYHYYSVSYPRDKAYLRPFMGLFPDGDIELGLEELTYASGQSNVGQAQALYYLTDIYQFETGDHRKAMESAGNLHQLFPRNTWFHADYTRSLLKARRFSQARQECEKIRKQYESIGGSATRVIESTESQYTSQVMIRIYHYLGQLAYHGSGEIQTAKSWFLKSQNMVRLSKMERYEYAAYNMFYLGLCEDKLGNRGRALDYYEAALDHPDAANIEQAVERCEEEPCTSYSLNN